MSPDFYSILSRLAVDLISIFILSYVIFYLRHSRRDVLMMMLTFNIGIFLVLTVITAQEISQGIGFGLFAILSLIRLRSSTVDNIQLGYIFMALVIGLINGFEQTVGPLSISLNAIALIAVLLADLNFRRRNSRVAVFLPEQKKISVVLDQAVGNDEQALSLLTDRFDYEIERVVVDSVDFIQGRSKVRFYYLAQPEPYVAGEDAKKTEQDDDDD